ncbi:GNAT family N-acetyltransferase [Saccharibacillus alkalitolerans]|uniref:GNAT family N-acetyltransferase n=1 Tax=Saccharibacillus alkalitolerans TaxID=2705290 RepID=A0ABX0FC66_9BACL|nr:GNAT family N-acetyltransferase [Saccharibacillus alkalitolerans]NGZ75642.1 GNAT family N-acetyltransferase [Saccharibacillus alkalitolerans]
MKANEANDSEIAIRREREGDAEQLSGLFGQLGYPGKTAALAERLDRLRRHEDYSIFVAERDGILIGTIALHRELPLLRDACEAWITALVVSEEARGSGVGGRLLERAEEWAREQGAAYVRLNSGNREERRQAHLFYRGRGYAAGSTGFAKALKQ